VVETQPVDLDEAQLISLDCLIYSQEIGKSGVEGKTVGEFVAYLQDNDYPLNKDFKGNPAVPGGMADESWPGVIDSIAQDPDLCSLVIQDVYINEETGAQMMCLVNPNDQTDAVFIFGGTGYGEWETDVSGSFMKTTMPQIECIAWVGGLVNELGITRIVASGHSNGGNKAAVCVVCFNDISYSGLIVDGQGINYKFINDSVFGRNLLAGSYKLTSIGNNRDFVGPLLNPFSKDYRYVSGSSPTGIPHVIDAIFTIDASRKVRINPYTTQHTAMKFEHDFTLYLINNASDEELKAITSFAGGAANKIMGEKEDAASTLIDSLLHPKFQVLKPPAGTLVPPVFTGSMYVDPGAVLLVKYFSDYIQELKTDNPELYETYRTGFIDELVRGYGLNPVSAAAVWRALETGSVPDYIAIASVMVTADKLGGYEYEPIIRDFTDETYQALMDAISDAFDPVTDWDVRGWVDWDASVRIGSRTFEFNPYDVPNLFFDKIEEFEDSSRKKVEKIFSDVATTDSDYAEKANDLNDKLTNIDSALRGLAPSGVIGGLAGKLGRINKKTASVVEPVRGRWDEQ
jgi:hypothetical protein